MSWSKKDYDNASPEEQGRMAGKDGMFPSYNQYPEGSLQSGAWERGHSQGMDHRQMNQDADSNGAFYRAQANQKYPGLNAKVFQYWGGKKQ